HKANSTKTVDKGFYSPTRNNRKREKERKKLDTHEEEVSAVHFCRRGMPSGANFCRLDILATG
ncbi:hypothetical protein J6590_010070, partial [Homalodisca vitripennis]